MLLFFEIRLLPAWIVLMRLLLAGMSLALLLLSPFIGLPLSLRAEDLIPPTRTLESSAERLGTLTVVSEPPNLEVFLDGSEVGHTPVWLKYVKPGMHNLRVGDSQIDVYAQPGRTRILSFFHGSFIEVPEEKEAPKQKESEPEKQPEGRKGIKGSAEESEKNLTPWDWQRFLNRTSPGF